MYRVLTVWMVLLCVSVLTVGAMSGPAAATASGVEEGPTTVTATAAGGVSTAGSSGSPGGSGWGSTGAGDGAGQTECTYLSLVLNDEGGFAPGGPTPGGWYSVTCTNSASGAQVTQTVWIPDQAAPAPGPVVSPLTVALSAERSMTLPRPAPSTDPVGTAVVNLPTWLWVDASLWHPRSVTASVGTVSATAVATPVSVVWSMGDGTTVTCAGPGTAFVPGRSSATRATDCEATYRRSSAGQPSPDGRPDDGSFVVTASVTWWVTWTSAGAPGGGTLPVLVTSASTRLRCRADRERGHFRVTVVRTGRGGVEMTALLDRGPTGTTEPATPRTQSRLPAAGSSRRPMVVVASAFVVFASIAVFTSVYSSATRQQAVIVVTHDIQQGQVITSSDLGQARVSIAGGVVPVPVAEASELNGKRASVTIPAGSLLVSSDLTTAPQVAPGNAIVGLSLKPGQLPSEGVKTGDQVMVVQTASPGTAVGSVGSLSGSGGVAGGAAGVLVPEAPVFQTAAPSAAAGDGASELVSIEVSATLAAAVTTAAVADQVSLVLLPAGSSGSASTGSVP